MQERITVVGRAAGVPQRVVKETGSGAPGPVSFRFAASSSRYDDATKSWVESDTNWYTVKAWRGLADNALASVTKGQPLIVHGRLELHTWTDASGRERLTPTIHADHLGHDLRRGTSVFTAIRSSTDPVDRSASTTTASIAAIAPESPAPVPSMPSGTQEVWADPTELVDLPF